MIKKINKISNYGQYRTFTWQPSISDFAKFNVFYGWNGSGKSTLSSALDMLSSTANPIDFSSESIQITDMDGRTQTGPSQTDSIGISNDKIVFKIPYPSEDGEKMYSCETDIIVSPYSSVKFDTKAIDKNEIVISLKTTSKDRMGKIFLDKLLMQKFAKHPVKVIGIFLNDVQRKETKKTAILLFMDYLWIIYGLFMVYTQFLTKLEGVYFVDPPPITRKNPFNKHIAPFSKFIVVDIWKLLSP